MAHTVQHVRDVFYRMGFTDKEIVALLGAHSMGRCHTDRSGYWRGYLHHTLALRTPDPDPDRPGCTHPPPPRCAARILV